MTNEAIRKITTSFADRAEKLLDEGYSAEAMTNSAIMDFKALGSMTGIMSIMANKRLNEQQTDLVERIMVKLLAVQGVNAHPPKPGIPPDENTPDPR